MVSDFGFRASGLSCGVFFASFSFTRLKEQNRIGSFQAPACNLFGAGVDDLRSVPIGVQEGQTYGISLYCMTPAIISKHEY